MDRHFELNPKLKYWESKYGNPRGDIRSFVSSKDDLQYFVTNEPDYYSQGIGGYFLKAWASHAGIVITPDLLWQLAMSEFVKMVVAHPEEYREVFTTSNEKTKILVQGPTSLDNFITQLIEGVRVHSPFDVQKITPKFTTTSNLSYLSTCALTLECVSQYYDYAMYLCGFPSITVKGTYDDWINFRESLYNLVEIIGSVGEKYKSVVEPHMAWAWSLHDFAYDHLIPNLANPAFWDGMYIGEECGSGSDFYVTGWITKFLLNSQKLMGKNFPHAIANVKYTVEWNQKEYEIYAGVIGSKRIDVEEGKVIFEPVHGLKIVGNDIIECGLTDVRYTETPKASSGAKRAFDIAPNESKDMAKPVRQDITVLPSEEPKADPVTGEKKLRLGWGGLRRGWRRMVCFR